MKKLSIAVLLMSCTGQDLVVGAVETNASAQCNLPQITMYTEQHCELGLGPIQEYRVGWTTRVFGEDQYSCAPTVPYWAFVGWEDYMQFRDFRRDAGWVTPCSEGLEECDVQLGYGVPLHSGDGL